MTVPYFEAVSPTQPSWLYGTEPGRAVAPLGLALVTTIVAVTWVLDSKLGLFYDLSFVTVCLLLAVRIRDDEFGFGVALPPALMAAVLVLLAFASPEMIADESDGFVQAFVTGLATHSLALLIGWGLALLALEIRRRRVFSVE